MSLLSYFKENKELKKRVSDLELSIRSNKVMLDNMQHRHDEEIREKDALIESLNSKIDILHKYYDIDKEPTQEVKTAMRIDERVHDLELENIRLNSYLSCLSSIGQNQQNIMLSRINYPNGGIIYV